MVFAGLGGNNIFGQSKFTPYDNLPGIIKSYKPAYSNNYVGWAKMLYQYPVNFNEITNSFEKYMNEHPGEKSAIIRYYKIWSNQVGVYATQDGVINLPDVDELNFKTRQMQLKAHSKLKAINESNSNWTFLGPKQTFALNKNDEVPAPGVKPWQVNVYSIDVAPSNENIIYAGTETGFVNKSIDKGETWHLLALDYPFGKGGIRATAIDPTNPDIVYVSAGNQIHKTVDGGTTWTPLLPSNNIFYPVRMKIDLTNPSKIITSSSDGVHVSFDAGDTWQKKWTKEAWDIDFKPGNSDSVFVLSVNSSGYYDFLVSTDGGVSFSVDASFPSDRKEKSGGLIAVTPANENVIFVTLLSIDEVGNAPYVYKGVFDGSAYSWQLLKKGEDQSTGGLGGFTNGQGYFDLILAVSPVDENIVFWGTCSIYKSTDGGSNYTKIGGYGGDFKMIHPDIQDIKMMPNGDTWVSTDGGVNYTSDNFISQDNHKPLVNGLVGSDMWGFGQGWNEDIVVGGRYHNGNVGIADFYGDKALSLGGAESSTGWVIQGRSRHAAFTDIGNIVLPKTAESVPEGNFSFNKFPNMENHGGRRSNLLFHPNYHNTVYVSEENGFWRSMDGGVEFELLNTFGGEVMYMQISFKNPDVIYVDVAGSGLHKSEDGGLTWIHKPSLTDGTSGSSSWNGYLFFDISPYDESVVYACYTNSYRTSNVGRIYRSSDGGDTWTEWTAGLSEYTKNLIVQPTTDGVDLVYLINSTGIGKTASVYYRRSDENSWTKFDDGFPKNMRVNLGLPFFRDSKLRIAGRAGVWESPLQEEVFTPLVNPWCPKKEYDCSLDTVCFDDHSMLNHEGAAWHWEFSPAPLYINNSDIRNPKVVFGEVGACDVTMSVTIDGQTYSHTISEMVLFSSCPSIYDCNNPAEIPKAGWSVLDYDYQKSDDRSASKAIDGDVGTFWQTLWNTSYTYPHFIEIDMGETYMAHKFIYLPRQDGKITGNIGDYKLYMSLDKDDWGEPVKIGTFSESSSPKTVVLDSPVEARYFRFLAESEVNDAKVWCAVAELSVVGCVGTQTDINDTRSEVVKAWPVPTDGIVNLALFKSEGQELEYTMFNVSGQVVDRGFVNGFSDNFTIDLSEYLTGLYFIILQDKQGVKYRVKVVKK